MRHITDPAGHDCGRGSTDPIRDGREGRGVNPLVLAAAGHDPFVRAAISHARELGLARCNLHWVCRVHKIDEPDTEGMDRLQVEEIIDRLRRGEPAA